MKQQRTPRLLVNRTPRLERPKQYYMVCIMDLEYQVGPPGTGGALFEKSEDAQRHEKTLKKHGWKAKTFMKTFK